MLFNSISLNIKLWDSEHFKAVYILKTVDHCDHQPYFVHIGTVTLFNQIIKQARKMHTVNQS